MRFDRILFIHLKSGTHLSILLSLSLSLTFSLFFYAWIIQISIYVIFERHRLYHWCLLCYRKSFRDFRFDNKYKYSLQRRFVQKKKTFFQISLSHTSAFSVTNSMRVNNKWKSRAPTLYFGLQSLFQLPRAQLSAL